MEVGKCGPGSTPSIPATYREVEFWRFVHVHRLLLNRWAPPSTARRRSHGRSTINMFNVVESFTLRQQLVARIEKNINGITVLQWSKDCPALSTHRELKPPPQW